MPPAPIGASMRYGPSRTPALRAITSASYSSAKAAIIRGMTEGCNHSSLEALGPVDCAIISPARAMSRALTAADLGVPETFNVATHFVDRHVREGRGAKVAIECGDERVTYAALLEGVNRFGSALRDLLEVRPEERVVLLLLDTPAFPLAFFGAIKIGAVPIPTSTLWKPSDYRYVLNDSRARVAVC